MGDNLFFDGFMPAITSVSISQKTSSISSDGDLIDVHCVTINSNEKEYIFSISPSDLQRLHFLILKCLL